MNPSDMDPISTPFALIHGGTGFFVFPVPDMTIGQSSDGKPGTAI